METIDGDVRGHLTLQVGKSTQDTNEGILQNSPIDSFSQYVQKENNRMETIWKRTMNQQYQVSNKYKSVAALIVRWDDELDMDLNCKYEVDELNVLFKDSFHFNSTVLKLDTVTKPQQQLNYAVANLVRYHDGPARSHLLIVYYSGHGIGKGGGELELAGNPKHDVPILEGGGRYPPRLRWLLAERDLDDAEADVLIVLDCCCAACIMRKDVSDDSKAHEVLAASGRSQVAERPGPRSFTRHFIDALKEELDKNVGQPFTTYDLNDTITRRRMDSTKIESKIFNRHANIRNKRHIALAPLDHPQAPNVEECGPRQKRAREVATPAAALDLKVAFNNRTILKDVEVQQLATKMFEAAKSVDISISSIDWMGFKPRREVVLLKQSLQTIHAVVYAKRWKRLVRRSKKRKAGALHSGASGRPTKRPIPPSGVPDQIPAWNNRPLSPTPSDASNFDSPRPPTESGAPEG